MSLAMFLLSGKTLFGQEAPQRYYSPWFGIKSNTLYWATATPNLGLEFGLGAKTTLEVSGNYNPFTFNDGRKWKHWLVQPELRFWTCEKFNGHFFGVHGFYGEFNAANLKILNMENYRKEGDLWGAGISYGYQWIIGKRWNLEATIGVGYAHLSYDTYECGHCGDFVGHKVKNYVGPTKIGLSFIYFIR